MRYLPYFTFSAGFSTTYFLYMAREVTHTSRIRNILEWNERYPTPCLFFYLFCVLDFFLASIELKLKLGQKRWKAFPIWLDNKDRRHCATHSGWPFSDLWPSRVFVVLFPNISFLYGGNNNEVVVHGSMESVILSIRNFFQFYCVRWMGRFATRVEEGGEWKKRHFSFHLLDNYTSKWAEN